MKRLLCILAAALSLSAVSAFAQKATVSGYVTDAATGETLIGAGVVEDVSGAVTNSYGFYTLTLTKGRHTLLCSYVGYSDQEITLDLQKDTTLNIHLGPRITRHGTMLEVYGEGILITGESGVGKSETAIELVKRGHRLIADDAVEIMKVSYRTLFAQSPPLIQHYIELRGIGVVDVMRLFGMGAIKSRQELDLIINIETWQDGMMYDRLGLENQYTTLLGVQVPIMKIPVKPGRNLAVIIEVAAMNNRQKKLGYNSAREFTERINRHFEESMRDGGNG